MSKQAERWAIVYGANGVSIEPAMSGCRQYECCLGRECGFSAAEVQDEVASYHQRQADYWRGMTPDEFLVAQGYPAPSRRPAR